MLNFHLNSFQKTPKIAKPFFSPMFPQWLKSPKRRNPSPKSPSRFSFSSFKDINTILNEEDETFQSYPQSPKRPSIFHRVKLSSASALRSWASVGHTHHHAPLSSSQPSITLPYFDQRVILYLTTLRVVRRTYEDCKTVRSILRGYGVPIDERDLSLDSDYVDELQGIIGRNGVSRSFTLPLLFIGGKCIGGAEEIKRLHECGELKDVIGRLPIEVGSGVCDLCGGLRYVLCRECNGSHRIYIGRSGFRTCNHCNVNGLTRCPSCSPCHRRFSFSFS